MSHEFHIIYVHLFIFAYFINFFWLNLKITKDGIISDLLFICFLILFELFAYC